MAVFQVKKYKIIKGDNGNKIQILKTKKEWNKETKNGTMTWFFSDRYILNDKVKQYKSSLFALKREVEEEERLFLINPIEYIKNHSKRAKINLKIEIEKQIKNEKMLNDYFDDFILYKKTFIKGASIYEAKQDWKCHIKSALGNLTPNELEFIHIQKWYKNTNIKINPKTNNLYSTETKNKWLSTLNEFFEYLKSEGIIKINFSKILGMFKNPNINKNSKKKIRYQTLEQFNFFMKEITDEFWYTFLNFLFWHGCRMGEQRAIRIKDVDFKKNIIHLHETFTKDENGKETLGPIKNRKERYIYISPQSKPYLIKLINKYKLLDGYNDEYFLFGGPQRIAAKTVENQLNYLYNSLISKYSNENIIRLTHHEFGRHSHASYLLDLGLKKGLYLDEIIQMIAQRLGDTPEVIKRTYAHPYEDETNIKIEQLLKF